VRCETAGLGCEIVPMNPSRHQDICFRTPDLVVYSSHNGSPRPTVLCGSRARLPWSKVRSNQIMEHLSQNMEHLSQTPSSFS
jgi:hypothetical protein